MIDLHTDAEIGASALEAMRADIERDGQAALRAAVDAAVLHAKATALYKDRTGTLRANTYGSISGWEAWITADTPYAHWVEAGRGPVEAKNARVLRFVINGTVYYRRSVGPAAPRPFVAEAAVFGQEILKRFLEAAVDRAVRTHLGP